MTVSHKKGNEIRVLMKSRDPKKQITHKLLQNPYPVIKGGGELLEMDKLRNCSTM